jgi:hypothetical protein
LQYYVPDQLLTMLCVQALLTLGIWLVERGEKKRLAGLDIEERRGQAQERELKLELAELEVEEKKERRDARKAAGTPSARDDLRPWFLSARE